MFMLFNEWQEFPPKSKLDPTVYGDQTSTITKEHLEINLGGLSVEQVSHIYLITKRHMNTQLIMTLNGYNDICATGTEW